MKAMLPIRKLKSNEALLLADDFITCDSIGIADTTSGDINLISIDFLREFYKGGGFISLIRDEKIGVVISPSINKMSIKLFSEEKLDLFKAEGTSVKFNLELLKNNKLSNYNYFTDTNSESCSSSLCSSCSSTSCSS